MTATEDIIPAERAGTLDGLFRERVRRSPDAIACRSFDKPSQSWVDLTWTEVATRVARWRLALRNEPLQTGDRVALLMRNGPDWLTADQAALSLGLVVVPLYTDDRPENVAYILGDAAVKVLVVQASVWKRVAPACRDLTALQTVVIVGDEEKDKSAAALDADSRVRHGSSWVPVQGEDGGVPQRDPHSLATIVYTSGTTGRPKGVMLSHYNILSVAHAALTMYDIYVDDLFLSFLPLSHTFERTVGYYVPVMGGASIAYARSIAQLAEDLKAVQPTVLIAVPRIFERFHARIQQQLQKRTPVARLLFRLAVKCGWKRFEYQQRRAGALGSFAARLLWPVMDALVASKIRGLLGGRLRLAVSGGAPLPLAVAQTMIGLGVPIAQGYGLTETSPVISANPFEHNDPASVGIALRGIEVKVGENNELLVHSPGVMMGYWNNHAATAASFDADGWFRTGDQVRIEDDHIYIIGRIKDILVLSNGEKIPPGDMETAIVADPLFEQAMVIGEGKPYLSAILVLNPEEWIRLANSVVVDPYQRGTLRDSRIHNKVIAQLRKLLAAFPGFAKIRRVHLTLDPWTVDNGLLTPTLKVKRNVVLEKYADAIRRLYEE